MKTSFKDLKERNILSKEQMQNVKGGGTCGFVLRYEDGSREVRCGMNKESVDFFLANSTAVAKNWCCDSCDSTSYCG